MRILIVEDEYVSRRKLEKFLSVIGECHSVTTVADAYKLFLNSIKENFCFDLISLDIVLPDGCGIDLLYKIRDLEKRFNIPESKRVKVIMATSHSDIERVRQCVKLGCNDFIVKPFNKKKVLEKLQKLVPIDDVCNKERGTVDIIEEIVKKLKKGDLGLPTISNTWMLLQDAVSQGANLDEIAHIIKQDPTVCYKIIATANSPIYKSVKKIVKIEDALSRIGLDIAIQHVHNIYAKSYFHDNSGILAEFSNDLWVHSVAVANLCSIICKTLQIELEEDPYLLGLFHDIGKLVLIKAISELLKMRKCDDVKMQDILMVIGNFHSELGMALLSAHNFPYVYLKVAKFHNHLEGCSHLSKEILVVNLANEIVKSQGYVAGIYVPTELNSLISYKILNPGRYIDEFILKLKEVMDIATLI